MGSCTTYGICNFAATLEIAGRARKSRTICLMKGDGGSIRVYQAVGADDDIYIYHPQAEGVQSLNNASCPCSPFLRCWNRSCSSARSPASYFQNALQDAMCFRDFRCSACAGHHTRLWKLWCR